MNLEDFSPDSDTESSLVEIHRLWNTQHSTPFKFKSALDTSAKYVDEIFRWANSARRYRCFYPSLSLSMNCMCQCQSLLFPVLFVLISYIITAPLDGCDCFVHCRGFCWFSATTFSFGVHLRVKRGSVFSQAGASESFSSRGHNVIPSGFIFLKNAILFLSLAFRQLRVYSTKDTKHSVTYLEQKNVGRYVRLLVWHPCSQAP